MEQRINFNKFKNNAEDFFLDCLLFGNILTFFTLVIIFIRLVLMTTTDLTMTDKAEETCYPHSLVSLKINYNSPSSSVVCSTSNNGQEVKIIYND